MAELRQDRELGFMARHEEKTTIAHVGKFVENRQQPNRIHVLSYRLRNCGRGCCRGMGESTITNGEASRDAATIRGDTEQFPGVFVHIGIGWIESNCARVDTARTGQTISGRFSRCSSIAGEIQVVWQPAFPQGTVAYTCEALIGCRTTRRAKSCGSVG